MNTAKKHLNELLRTTLDDYEKAKAKAKLRCESTRKIVVHQLWRLKYHDREVARDSALKDLDARIEALQAEKKEVLDRFASVQKEWQREIQFAESPITSQREVDLHDLEEYFSGKIRMIHETLEALGGASEGTPNTGENPQ